MTTGRLISIQKHTHEYIHSHVETFELEIEKEANEKEREREREWENDNNCRSNLHAAMVWVIKCEYPKIVLSQRGQQ